jgi:hypothetical protein
MRARLDVVAWMLLLGYGCLDVVGLVLETGLLERDCLDGEVAFFFFFSGTVIGRDERDESASP